jgi:hypothetical protein
VVEYPTPVKLWVQSTALQQTKNKYNGNKRIMAMD